MCLRQHSSRAAFFQVDAGTGWEPDGVDAVLLEHLGKVTMAGQYDDLLAFVSKCRSAQPRR